MEYYVISPNIYNDGDNYADLMFEKGIATVGWNANDLKGVQFKSIKNGDCIIVAKRNNWRWEYYYLGLVIGEEETASYGTLSKKLSPIIKLDSNCKLNFDIWSANGSNQIPSPQRIDSNKGSNRLIIKQINSLLLMEKYINLLRTNHNLILTGAPGTGKTYLAKAIAEAMGAETKFVQFHPSYDYTDFVEGLRPINKKRNVGFERRNGVFKEFCKEAYKANIKSQIIEEYHKAYKEIKEGKLLEIPVRKGHTKKTFCEDSGQWGLTTGKERISNGKLGDLAYLASVEKLVDYGLLSKRQVEGFNGEFREIIGGNDSDIKYVLCYLFDQIEKHKGSNKPPYVFIIDEINRGEISKIFGELFFSIDPGYRGEKGMVQTQYQNMVEENDVFKKGFYVPENVYIIGTMNDIDRSVESMDFAMRRRFAWKEVTAEDSFEAMKEKMTNAEEVKKRMFALNKAIAETPSLNKSYQIGAAYFLKLEEYDGDFGKLWENHLKGLLFEYLRGNRNAEEQMEKLEAAYNGITESRS